MPRFATPRNGRNERLEAEVRAKIAAFFRELFEEDEVFEVEGVWSFAFGSVSCQVQIVPWHADDCLVRIFSYLARTEALSADLAGKLLRLNATVPFGSFGLTFDGDVVFSHSLAGANLDRNEFEAALVTVATVADQHDEMVRGIA